MASSYIRRRGPLGKMGHVGPNMTPMVDVVLCVLLFFMLTTTFAAPEFFLTSTMPAIGKEGLGSEGSRQKLPAVRMSIDLRRIGDETFVNAFGMLPMKMDPAGNNQAILDMFREKKKNLSDDVQIIIVPEKTVRYQDVITIYDFCTAAQFRQVAFAPAR